MSPSTLNLGRTDNSRVVIDVVDLERHEIFQMLKDLSDKESRVIGVINKCDTKQKQSHDWVITLRSLPYLFFCP